MKLNTSHTLDSKQIQQSYPKLEICKFQKICGERSADNLMTDMYRNGQPWTGTLMTWSRSSVQKLQIYLSPLIRSKQVAIHEEVHFRAGFNV